MYNKWIIDTVLKKLDTLSHGQLTLVTPDGKTRTFVGKQDGDTATLHMHDWSVIPNIVKRGDIGFAEGYRQGKWSTDNLVGLLTLGLVNRTALDAVIAGRKWSRTLAALSYMLRVNTLRGSRKNIHAHYDLGNSFYKLWLDSTMTYSSAMYNNADDDLSTAQRNKYNRIVQQMDTPSGKVLEIGSGWGGFAEHALQQGDFDIKGITLSTEQLAYSQQRLQPYKTAHMALEDYRLQQGTFDRIVSIEMFEAVGEKFWSTYFQKLQSLLKSNGRAVIQVITMNDKDFPRYRKGGDFIRSYIFPGGMLPSPSKFSEHARKADLHCENIYCFGQHYARTLQTWLNNFDARHSQILQLGFDEGFMRLWRFYLAGCIAGFKTGRTDVMQVDLVHA